MIGWAFECAWQLFFLLESPAGMWVCLVMILCAFAAFAQTLLRLYRYTACRCASDFLGHRRRGDRFWLYNLGLYERALCTLL